MFRQSYAIKDKVNLDDTLTPYVLATVNTTDKYFTISGGIGDLNLNPLKSGHKWIGYRLKRSAANSPPNNNIPTESRYRPKWIITKHINDRLYYTTIEDPNETTPQEEPAVNDHVEFLNPFINYTHVKEDELPLFPDLSGGTLFNGLPVSQNNPVGIMNRGNDIVLFLTIKVEEVTGGTPVFKDLLVYTITEDLVTWSEPVEIVVTGLDIEGINTGGDTVYDFGATRIVYIEEAGKPSDRYIVLGFMSLIDGDGVVEGSYRSFFVLNENFEIEDNRLVSFSINNPPIFGNDLTKYNGNWRTIFYDTVNFVFKERVFYVEIDDLISNPILANYSVIDGDYTEATVFLDDGAGKNIKDRVIEDPTSTRYLNYNNKLYLAALASLTSTFIDSSYYNINKAHNAFYIGTLVHNGDGSSTGNYHWYWNRTNPFICSPMNYGLATSISGYEDKYMWQSGDPLGLVPLVFENEIYFFTAFQQPWTIPGQPYYNSSLPQTTLIKLTDFTKKTLEDVIVDYIETNITTNQTQYSKVIVCNNTSVIAINLLPSVDWNGKEIIIKRLGSGNVNITPYTGDSIDGIVNSIYTLSSSNESVILKSVGNDIKKIN